MRGKEEVQVTLRSQVLPSCHGLGHPGSSCQYQNRFRSWRGAAGQRKQWQERPSLSIVWTWASLSHWGRVTHICVSKLTIIGSDNGLSPGRRQAIIWTNAGMLLIGPLGTNVSEIFIEIYTFSFSKMHLKMSSGKWRPFCLGLNVLNYIPGVQYEQSWGWHGNPPQCDCMISLTDHTVD